MAAAAPTAGGGSWPLDDAMSGGVPRPVEAAAFAERLSAVGDLLYGHCREAKHLAVQLEDLRAETARLTEDISTIAGPRPMVSSGHREGHRATGSTCHPCSLTLLDVADPAPERSPSRDVPGMLCDEQPAQAEVGANKDFLAVPCSEPFPCDWSDVVPAAQRGREVRTEPLPYVRKDTTETRSVPLSAVYRLGSHFLRSKSANIFADAEDLKEQIRTNLTEEAPDITDYYHDTGWCQRVARSHAFESLSLAIICINAAWIAVEIDLNHADYLLEAEPIFQVVAHFFCVFFVLELFVRIMAFKRKRHVFREKWLLFDGVLVFLMVFETWAMLLLSAGSTPSTGNLRAFVVFRILRLLRVLRLARVLREMPELLVIVRAIAIAFRAISIVLVLLGLLIYMGAIVFRVLLEDTTLGRQRFGTVPAAMGTLLLEVTLSGTRGGPVVREASSEHLAYGCLVLAFVLVANVTVMGVLGGLLVQTVKTVAEVEKEEAQVKSMAHTMDDLWELLVEDQDHRESITERQLKGLLTEKSVAKVLEGIGVDLEGLVNASGFIFEQHEGTLSKPQFKRMVLDLRGKNAAKVKDHVETRRFIDMMFKRSGQRTTRGGNVRCGMHVQEM